MDKSCKPMKCGHMKPSSVYFLNLIFVFILNSYLKKQTHLADQVSSLMFVLIICTHELLFTYVLVGNYSFSRKNLQ